MTAPTPGPWRVMINTSGDRAGLFSIETDSVNVARVTGRADADLIAASPDLLSACEDMVDLWDNWIVSSDCIQEPLKRSIGMRVEQARAAIRMARGE